MNIKVKDIINRVTLLYHDVDMNRLTPKQYLQLLDDAVLQLVLVRPDSHEKREIIKLEEGPRQKIPADAFTLIDVYSNKIYLSNSNQFIDGKPVYQVARKDLDYFTNWYNSNHKPSSTIDEFAFDIRTPRDFWVNPPVRHDDEVFVEIGYSCAVPQVSDIDKDFEEVLKEELPISIEFRNAIVNYMLYLCYSTDSTSQFDRTIADKYLQAFTSMLEVENQSSLSDTSRIIENTTQGLGIHNNVAQQPTR